MATVQQLSTSSSFQAFYDLKMAYAHEGGFLQAPEMLETIREPRLDRNSRFHVHMELFDRKDLAGKSDLELAKWQKNRCLAKSRDLEIQEDELE